MKQLYIVRHGETEWNVLRRMQGRLDSPLTDRGRAHANTSGTLIKSLGGLDRLWASPSGRTMETAFIVNSYTQAPIDYADELMERDCGQWSGLTIEEIETSQPQAWAARLEDPYGYQPPGGENLPDMLARAHEFLDQLYAEEAETIGLITHGVMSKVILKFYLGLSEVECVRLRHPNDLVYRLTFHAQDIDTHHFVGGGAAREGVLRAQPQLERHPSGR